MHQQSAFLLLIVVAISTVAMVHGHLAAGTPAARFWEQALPGSPMPKAIADLVQKGIDQSPLVDQHYTAHPSISMCTLFNTICDTHTVAETGIFFHEEQLRPGSTMTLSFPAEVETPILPLDVADKVPFQNLGDVLTAFHISPGSAEAAQIEATLSKCQEPPLAGETKACTTSLEGTVQAAMEMLGVTAGSHLQGGGDYVWAAASALPGGGFLPRQQYVMEAVSRLDGSGYVSCHKVPFPYAVYQCHATDDPYGDYMVSLRGLHGGPAVSLLAFCHFDTSCWNPMHPAFQILNTHPGRETPVCHFMSYGNLAFVKKAGAAC